MKDRGSISGSPWEQGFELSYKLACEQLAKIKDMEGQCRKSGARYLGPHEIVVKYLNQPYHITFPKDIPSCHCEADVVSRSNLVEVPLRDKILILHYFILAKGSPAVGRLITYKQLPGGMSYFAAFSQRTVTPLVNHFGQNPELLIGVAAKLGGRETNYGNVSVTINAFEHVPITLVLWKGDEELAPNGNILFDANISDYLSTEDVAVLSETIIWKFVKGIPSG